MAYSDQALITDVSGKPIPQYYNEDTDSYLPLRGGCPIEPFSGSTTVTHTFAQIIYGFGITNDGSEDLTFAIGTDTYTVKPGEVWEYTLPGLTAVTITTTSAYRAWGLI